VLIAIGGLLLPTLMTPTPAHASRARVRTLRDISGPSPLPADECGLVTGQCSTTTSQFCKTDSDCALPSCSSCTPGETCISEHGSEYEPDIAVNPANRRNLIAVYSQDAQITTVVSTSRDRGRHWTQVLVPGLSQCTGGTAVGTADPHVAIGPDGIAYTCSLTAESTGTTPLLVNTSADGGLSWSNPVTVDDKPIVDGPFVTADPHRPATAYLTWTRVPAVLPFSRTTDGGVTWTSPTIIPITPESGESQFGTQIHVLPDGTLVHISLQERIDLTRCGAGCVGGPTDVRLVRSADQGDHWSDPPILVTTVDPNTLKDPDSGTVIGHGISFPIPRVAVGADGTLYVVWHLIKSTTSSQIQFVKSVDGGLTWTAPAPVADETTQAFLPTVAVSPAGTIGVTYFDFRNDVLGDEELTTDLWFRHSHDGGATWSETHVAGPFDLRLAPSPGAFPLGDYFGLAPMGRTGFGALWVQTISPQDQGATDTFFARLRVSPRP